MAQPGKGRHNRKRNRAVRQVNPKAMKTSYITRVAMALALTAAFSSCHIYKKYETPTSTALTKAYAEAREMPADSAVGGRVHRPDAGLAHQAGAGQQQRPAQRPAQRRHSPRQPQGRSPELPAVARPLAQRRGSILRRQRPQLDLHPARAAKLGNRHLRQDSQQQARRAGCPLPQRGIRPGRPQSDNIGRGFDLLLHSRRA